MPVFTPITLPFPPRRILVRGVNWLGDAVMTMPALARLRERFPEAHLALLTHEKLRDLWSGQPALNEVITLAPGEGLFSACRKLRGRAFDLALLLPNSPRSALEVWLAGIPQRLGYARPWRNWFLTQGIPARPGRWTMRKRSVGEIQRLVATDAPRYVPPAPPESHAHQIHDYLQLVAALGADQTPLPPRLEVTAAEAHAAAQKFGIVLDRPVFGLNPGAEYGPAKRWPVENFIVAAREIQERTNCAWLILGGKSDVPVAGQIESTLRNPRFSVQNLAGQTSLRELMAVLSQCRVLLTNDTGPMHLAAALGVPVVVPFGSTSPELTGPGLPGDSRHQLLKSDASCSPCFRRECPIDFRCLNGIRAERVVAALMATAGHSTTAAGPRAASARP